MRENGKFTGRDVVFIFRCGRFLAMEMFLMLVVGFCYVVEIIVSFG